MFQTVTLLGFALRRIPLPRPGRYLSAHPACLTLAQTDLPTRAKQILARLPGFSLRGSPLSPASRRSGRTRASLGLQPPPGLPSPGDIPREAGNPPSSLGQHVQARIEARLLGVSIAKSIEDLRRDPLSLLGFLHLVPARPGVGAEQVSMTLTSRVLRVPHEFKKKRPKVSKTHSPAFFSS